MPRRTCLRRLAYLPVVAIAALFLIGCPKGNKDFAAGKKAEELQDYDTALANYQRALRSDPTNVEYRLRALQMRFEDGQYHIEQGRKDRAKGQLEMALAEFQRAAAVDPSNEAADQEVKQTLELIAARSAATAPKSAAPSASSIDAELLSAPPQLKPLSREPINFRATEDARTVFETIGKLAGLSVLFDPDFVSRRISVELPGVTLEQALDAVSLESKAFWKPLTSTVIFVAPDNPQKRRDLQDEEVRTFYLSNSLTPQDLTEVVTGLRQLLDLRRVTQVNSQNAIVVRDTPDKLILAAKIIQDIDKARPEVLLHFQVLSASLDRLRDLGVLPGQSATIAFTPLTTNQPTSGGSSSSGSTSPTQITLGNLKNISLNDYSATLPGATATAILTDSKTHIIQDPEIRVTDGEKASLKIGQRVPVATGSFQAGVGVGVGGGAGVVNPLVNTQFQYIDVGVNIDVTPRVHPDGDVSLTLSLDVSSVVSQATIGGIQQPVIGQNKIGPDQIRLRPGEVSILGGLFQTTHTNSTNGIPGLAKLPFFKYLFSDNKTETQTNDILIVITPHVIRMPQISAADLRPLAAGTDTNVRVYYKDEEPQTGETPSSPLGPASATPPAAGAPAPSPSAPATQAAQLQFNPSSVTIKPGARVTLGLNVSNVSDLYSIPLLIHYNPAVIQVENVTNGGFLSGGTQEIAVVQRIDAQHGEVIVSATRQPNTPGVNGSGTLLGLVVRGVAAGTSPIQILQVNARNSQQKTIPMVSGEATIRVQ